MFIVTISLSYFVFVFLMQHQEQSPQMMDQELVLWSLQMRSQELACQANKKLKLQVQGFVNQEGNY
jgi:hypothetical protein